MRFPVQQLLLRRFERYRGREFRLLPVRIQRQRQQRHRKRHKVQELLRHIRHKQVPEHSKVPVREHSKVPVREHNKVPVREHNKVPVQEHSKARAHSMLAQEHSNYDVPSSLRTVDRTTSDGCFRSMLAQVRSKVLARSKVLEQARSKEPVLVRSMPVLVHSSRRRVP